MYNNKFTQCWSNPITPWSRVLIEKLIVTRLVKKFPAFFWNAEVHYRAHKNPPLVLIFSQMHPFHTFSPYLTKIHSNFILPSTSRSSEWSLPFKFSDQNFVCVSHLSHACYILCQSNPPCFDHPNNVWWSVQVMKLLINRGVANT
jgi:hypothetical protein